MRQSCGVHCALPEQPQNHWVEPTDAAAHEPLGHARLHTLQWAVLARETSAPAQQWVVAVGRVLSARLLPAAHAPVWHVGALRQLVAAPQTVPLARLRMGPHVPVVHVPAVRQGLLVGAQTVPLATLPTAGHDPLLQSESI